MSETTAATEPRAMKARMVITGRSVVLFVVKIDEPGGAEWRDPTLPEQVARQMSRGPRISQSIVDGLSKSRGWGITNISTLNSFYHFNIRRCMSYLETDHHTLFAAYFSSNFQCSFATRCIRCHRLLAIHMFT